MEVKKGYKQTEVGEIPEDWEVDIVGNIANITTGSKNTQDHIQDGVYPFFVRSQTVERINSYSYDGEAVLTAGDGVGTGKVFHYIVGKFDVHQRVYRISDFLPTINGYYFFLYFSTHFYNRIMQMTAKSSVDSVRMEMITKMIVPVPPKNEQDAIATVLQEADKQIVELEKLLAKKRAVKQGAMQELLTGRRRLPGFSGEWENKNIFNLADRKKECFDDGDWIEAEFITDSGIRLVQTGNIGIGKFIDNVSRKYISPDTFIKLGCKEVFQGDILISRLAEPAGRACIMPELHVGKMITAVDVTIFRPAEYLVDRRFLVYLLSTRKWLNEVSEKCGGTTRNRIARSELGKINIKLPSIIEQRAIAEILSDIDTEIVELEEELIKARQIKQGMMQELLTGRIRLI